MRVAMLGLWLMAGVGGAHGACELLIGAASDLAPLEKELKAALAGCEVRISFGSSGMLSQQIRSGADFDVFLAADRRFAEGLGGELVPYARGRIALWSSKGLKWEDLGKAGRIAIANPALAPYGRAARQALERRGLWKSVESRIVFSENIRQAWQFARTGNVDAAIVSWSLAFREGGQPLPADWHDVIEQTAVIPRGARHVGDAQRFVRWLVSREGQKLFSLNGLEAVRLGIPGFVLAVFYFGMVKEPEPGSIGGVELRGWRGLAGRVLQVVELAGGFLPCPIEMGFLAVEGRDGAEGLGQVVEETEGGELVCAEVGILLPVVATANGEGEFVGVLASDTCDAPLEARELGDELVFLGVGGAVAAHGGVVEGLPVGFRFPRADVVFDGGEAVLDGVFGGYGFAFGGFGSEGAAAICARGFLLLFGSRFGVSAHGLLLLSP